MTEIEKIGRSYNDVTRLYCLGYEGDNQLGIESLTMESLTWNQTEQLQHGELSLVF